MHNIDAMAQTYPHAKVLLTLGKKASIYQEGKNRVHCNSYKVAAIDTTAAGDTYTGNFITSLQKGMAVKEAMEIASAAVALAVMKNGDSTSIPLLKEVEKAEFWT